jgi:dTDP-4-dehydrorhamnose 3,5-epimerase
LKFLEIIDLPLAGAKLIEFARFTDHRGYFSEVFQKEDFTNLFQDQGLPRTEFVQVNESCSKANVLRGLHFQYDPPLGKMVRILYGRAVDMALDVRLGSPTFGQMIFIDMPFEPNADRTRWIWIPPGLAHGNFYLEESAIEYFCTAFYNPNGEVGISPLASDLDLKLCPAQLKKVYLELIKGEHIISDRDRQGITLADWRLDPRAKQVQ